MQGVKSHVQINTDKYYVWRVVYTPFPPPLKHVLLFFLRSMNWIWKTKSAEDEFFCVLDILYKILYRVGIFHTRDV